MRSTSPAKDVEHIQTARLVGERLGPHAFEDIQRLYSDPDVMATLGGLQDADRTRSHLDEADQHWSEHGFGLWLLRDRDTAKFVGRAGLRHVNVGGQKEVEVAYAFLRPYWGRGLATEIATESVRIGFDSLRLVELVCFTLPSNGASQRVMEKAGFVREREVEHRGIPHVLYRVVR